MAAVLQPLKPALTAKQVEAETNTNSGGGGGGRSGRRRRRRGGRHGRRSRT